MLQNILEIIVKVDELDLEELYRTEPDYLYNRKKELIEKIIHGVDIKPWAAQLAELRLWLYLIWDFETSIENLTKKPLLPSLEFKIRQGDSLLSEIEGNPIILRNIGGINYLVPDIHAKVDQIIDLKKKYYQHENDMITKEQIENAEKELIAHILNRKSMALSKKLEGMYGEEKVAEPQHLFEVTEQQKLNFMHIAEKIKKEQDEIEAEIDRIDNLIKNLGNIQEKDYFIWEIDFAEIFFTKGGFDIIIGNPPYVRQEEIAPPLIEKEKINSEIKRNYKERLIKNIINIFGREQISKFNKKADYYVYFYFISLSLLKDGGIFVFINSNAWLDVEYGVFLQEFLLDNYIIIDIIDNEAKRMFKSADINTIIVSIKKPSKYEDKQKNLVLFVNHKQPFEKNLSKENIKDIYQSISLVNNDFYRIYPIEQNLLYTEGIDFDENLVINHNYIGSKWGSKFLRAPEILFKILSKYKNKLIEFHKIITISQRNNLQKFNKIEVLNENYKLNNNLPFLHSLKDIDCIHVDINCLPKSIKNPNKLIHYLIPDVISNRFVGDRLMFVEGGNFLINDSFFIAKLKDNYNKKIVLALMNSTLSLLFLEMFGRKTYAIGVMYIYGPEFKRQILLNPEELKTEDTKKIIEFFNTISIRKIGSIFHECGFNHKLPICSQEPNPLPDRKALDDIVFDVLGFTNDERKEVYWSICELVQTRLQKARSV